MVVGGFGEEREVTEEVAALARSLKKEIEGAVGLECSVFEPKVFASQVVAGRNYRIKIAVDDDGKEVEATIFQPLNHKPPQVLRASVLERRSLHV
mmetsp:Transcript_16825/g.54773  ORF Transcript_16825/g.54773 Transcript_16825/m.54773 type:complete len:95 (+) Transcript_16825:142-426(+)